MALSFARMVRFGIDRVVLAGRCSIAGVSSSRPARAAMLIGHQHAAAAPPGSLIIQRRHCASIHVSIPPMMV
eukprot:scaffold154554_cov27-Prasinocladus_malaysianus.AAC.1